MKQGEGTFNYDDSSNLKAVFDKDTFKSILKYQDSTGTIY